MKILVYITGKSLGCLIVSTSDLRSSVRVTGNCRALFLVKDICRRLECKRILLFAPGSL